MPSVTVPKEFFVKERRMYSNWQFAFWRELFQNSTDAGASNIRISLVDKGERLIGIEFEDNGNGMTRDVLESVYFKLGASTKNDGSTVGGFGRARLLTCFSMKSYTIHTLDNLVQGEGGDYEIADADHRRGCLIQLDLDNERIDILKQALEDYLGYSQLPCLVTINGERWTAWSHRRHLTRTLDLGNITFANVYVNKSAANSRLLIRVNGTIMYHQSIRAKAQVIVEIEPRLSREVLTANRDSMHWNFQSVLDNFIEELTVDTTSSLLSKMGRKTATVIGRGLILSSNPVTKVQSSREFGQILAGAAKLGQGIPGSLAGSLAKASIRIAEKTGEDGTRATENTSFHNTVLGDKHVHDLPDIFIIDDTLNENVRKVIDRYNPENWVVCERGGTKFNKGRDLYKLLMLWKVACQAAVESLMASHVEVPQIVWGLGWVFSDSAEASCKMVSGGHALLLNPVDSDGKMAYGLSSREDRKKLMALAKHEVAHIVADYHNEQFAGVLTDIDSKFDEKEVFRKMKEMISEEN